jgi:hypothetical protein
MECEIEYRGYKIKMERRGQNWLISVSPTRPELPILRHYSSNTGMRSEAAAVAEAQRFVDRVLRY